MKVRRLAKDAESGDGGRCAALYMTEDPRWMAAQGRPADTDTMAHLLELADDETAVLVPTETVVRAVEAWLAVRDASRS